MSLTKSQTNIAAMLAKAGRKVTVIDASDPRKEPIVQEFNHAPKPTMEDEDIIAELRAENNMLKGVLAQQPDMRAIVGELRSIQDWLHNGMDRQARRALSELLRRLDESQ